MDPYECDLVGYGRCRLATRQKNRSPDSRCATRQGWPRAHRCRPEPRGASRDFRHRRLIFTQGRKRKTRSRSWGSGAARGSVGRGQYPAGLAWRIAPAVQVLRQRVYGHHRAQTRGGPDRTLALIGSSRMANVVVCSPRPARWLPQPPDGDARMDLGLLHARAQRATNHWRHGRAGLEPTTNRSRRRQARRLTILTPDGVELTMQSEGKQSQQSLLIMDWGAPLGDIRRRFQDIARAEFGKQRKRLGVLSAEQETAIEALLMTTVNKVSHRAVAQMRRLIEMTG